MCLTPVAVDPPPISYASSASRPSGFSHTTCLPACAAATSARHEGRLVPPLSNSPTRLDRRRALASRSQRARTRSAGPPRRRPPVAPRDHDELGVASAAASHVRERAVSVRVGLPHERVAEHADADLMSRGGPPGPSSPRGSLTPAARGVERSVGGREVALRTKRERLARAPFALHAAVLPLDRQRTVVADPVQRADELIEVDVAVPGETKSQPRSAVAEVQMRGEDRPAPSRRRLASLMCTW